MRLTGHVKGLKKGTLMLQKIEDTLLVTVDSIKINGDGNFSFNEELVSPEVYYLYLYLENGTLLDERISFFAESGDIHIETSLKKFPMDALITGSKNQEKLIEFNALMERYNDKNLTLIEEYLEAIKEGRDSLISASEAKQESLLKSRYLAAVNFGLNHKDYELTPYLLVYELNNLSTKYMDTIYTSLSPKIKDSKYGKALESLVKSRKEE